MKAVEAKNCSAKKKFHGPELRKGGGLAGTNIGGLFHRGLGRGGRVGAAHRQ